jgi:hypothetical protein
MIVKRLIVLFALLSFSAKAAMNDYLTGLSICTPDQSNVFIASEAEKWIPGIGASFIEQLSTVSKAYRLSNQCPNSNLTARYHVTLYVTAAISGGARAYNVALSIKGDIIQLPVYSRFSIGVSTQSGFVAKEAVLNALRELLDGFASEYVDSNP